MDKMKKRLKAMKYFQPKNHKKKKKNEAGQPHKDLYFCFAFINIHQFGRPNGETLPLSKLFNLFN